MADEEAVFEKSGADGVVFAAKPQAIFHCAAGMADLEPQIPQDVEHRFDDALGPGGDLVGREKQQVDIRKRRHLAPAIAADRQKRQAFALGRVHQRVQPGCGEVESAADQAIGQPGIGAWWRLRLRTAFRPGPGRSWTCRFFGPRPGSQSPRGADRLRQRLSPTRRADRYRPAPGRRSRRTGRSGRPEVHQGREEEMLPCPGQNPAPPKLLGAGSMMITCLSRIWATARPR